MARRLQRLGGHLCPTPPALNVVLQTLAAGSGSSSKLRVGIIGLGDISEKSFAPSVLASPNAELVAVCRRNLPEAQAFAERWTATQGSGTIAAYGSAEELVADPNVDAVIGQPTISSQHPLPTT